MKNSDQSSSYSGWIIFITVAELVVCVMGCIGCGLSLWCLKMCRKMLSGMKILLCTYFTILFIICLVVLPSFSVTILMRKLGYQSKGILIFFRSLYTLLDSVERNVFMVIALYRMLAVCFPHQYKSWCRWQVVVAIEAAIVVLNVLLWSISFATREQQDDANTSDMGFVLFFIFLFVPYIVIIFTNAFTATFIHRRKRVVTQPEDQRSPVWDQVTLSLAILSITNLILDIPDIVMHLGHFSDKRISFFILHIIYRLHYLTDPFIFLGLNTRYRRRVMRLLSSCRTRNVVESHPQEEVAGTVTLRTEAMTGLDSTST